MPVTCRHYDKSCPAICSRNTVKRGFRRLGLLLLPADSRETAYKINNFGVIVGFGQQSGQPHAVVWANGAITDLGTLPGADSSFGRDINDLGQVVGESFFAPEGTTRAFVWQRGTMIDLGMLPGGANSYAQGTNQAGVIAGASDSGGLLHAVVWVKR
jgi:probable HAF family extracellular repeat protein